jgi:hypothetical protein
VRAVFRIDPDRFVESLDFPGNLNGVKRSIEPGNPADTAHAAFRRVPECFPANTVGAYCPNSCHNNPAFLHLDPPPV